MDRFTAVEVLDSSIVALPAQLAAAYRGGRSGTTQGDQAAPKPTLGLERLRDEARRRGEPVSARARARRTILVTDAPRDLLSLAGAPELARMRWQIERVFQLGKSHGGIDEWSASRPYKALCVAYGKLSALVVQQRTIGMGCWTRAGTGARPRRRGWSVRWR